MDEVRLPIKIDRAKVGQFCQERGIRKLSLFGSVLRADFDPTRSDIDVLAEFEPGALQTVGFRYFLYAAELSALLGRKVDFCSRLNCFVEDKIRAEAVPIYEQVLSA